LNNNFTQKAQNSLSEAQKLASEMGHTYIGSEHILYGLINEKESVASKLLESKGAKAEKVKEIISDYAGIGTKTELSAEDLTPRSKKIIELSAYEMANTASRYIGTEHILLALLSETDCVGLKILNSIGININELRSELLAFFTGSGNIRQKNHKNALNSNQSNDTPALSSYGRDLNTLAKMKKTDPIIGRDKEIERVIQILSRRTKNNPCLIGEPGVGKTAIVEGLAERIIKEEVPENLKSKRIITLDISSMIAGAKYRGEFEERMKNVMEDVSKNPDIILFIDELHTIVSAGAAEGALDAANILKPALARGEIQIIGATTIEEYRKHIEKDSALERRFQSVTISEPSEEQTVRILLGLREKYESHHHLKISDEAIEAAVYLSKRYIPDRFLPDKAIDLVDEAASKLRVSNNIPSQQVKNSENKIKQIENQKEKAIQMQDFELAAKLRDEEQREREEYKKQYLLNIDERSACSVVKKEDVADVVTAWTGIPVHELCREENENLSNLELSLKKYIVGQDVAVNAISRAVRRNKMGLKDPLRPTGVFLFLGPTGVGKTELAKALAITLFGEKNAMIRLDMSEYMEKHSVSRLIGSPPGYVGYGEAGQLSEKVHRRPYSLILLDEIEKAHPDVLNILLQVMDDGFLTDSQGRKIDFKNTIIIMTSNIGASELAKKSRLGFSDTENKALEEERSKIAVKAEMKKSFSPEFINRLDEIIVFNSLSKENIKEISRIMLNELSERIKRLNIEISFSENAIERICSLGYDDVYGARQLRRTVTLLLEDELANELLSGRIKEGDKIRADTEGDKIVFLR